MPRAVSPALHCSMAHLTVEGARLETVALHVFDERLIASGEPPAIGGVADLSRRRERQPDS